PPQPQSCTQSTRSLLQLPPLPPLAPALLLASVIKARTAALGIALPHYIGGDLAVAQATLGHRRPSQIQIQIQEDGVRNVEVHSDHCCSRFEHGCVGQCAGA
uniref:Uncharacterized protein n=3 Tax=Physcomitrium patens TaxID=3218 RepID=A0A7I4ANQ6_PHYPA